MLLGNPGPQIWIGDGLAIGLAQEKLFLSSAMRDNHGSRAEKMHNLPGGIATINQKGDYGSPGRRARLVA